jgi:hypothetical protein
VVKGMVFCDLLEGVSEIRRRGGEASFEEGGAACCDADESSCLDVETEMDGRECVYKFNRVVGWTTSTC